MHENNPPPSAIALVQSQYMYYIWTIPGRFLNGPTTAVPMTRHVWRRRSVMYVTPTFLSRSTHDNSSYEYLHNTLISVKTADWLPVLQTEHGWYHLHFCASSAHVIIPGICCGWCLVGNVSLNYKLLSPDSAPVRQTWRITGHQTG